MTEIRINVIDLNPPQPKQRRQQYRQRVPACEQCTKDDKRRLVQRNYSKRKYKRMRCWKKKKGGCVKCGLTDYRCLDHHHPTPGTRDTIVLCANCHRIAHAESR